MNITRTVTVPLAFVAGSAAALSVVPHADAARILPDAAEFAVRVVTAVVGTAYGLLSSSPALAWVVVGFLVTMVISARLAMGWQGRPDEGEGFDIR